MCDAADSAGAGWKGWPELSAEPSYAPVGPWLDLSHAVGRETPRLESFPAPSVARVLEIPRDPLTVSRLEMVVHTGTHVDSPRHFIADAPGIDAIPLERLMGRSVVIGLEKPCHGSIEPHDLEHARPPVEPGDILAIHCGWDERWGTADWGRHPSLSIEAARWLVDRRVKLVALDTPTPDLALDRRQPGFDWPVHRLLLGSGVLIAEQLTGLGALRGERVEMILAALPITDGDGAPVRAIARRIDG